MSSLEVAANIIMVAAVFLAARNHWSTWPLGVAGCLLFAALFYKTQLYANVTLQIFFIITNIAGWHIWTGAKSKTEPVLITRVQIRKVGLILLPIAVITALAYGALLAKTTDAHMSTIDSLVLTFSIVAQFLLMGRKLETWFFWIIVDIIAVPLFLSQGLYLTSIVYALFLANAVYGYLNWKSELNVQNV